MTTLTLPPTYSAAAAALEADPDNEALHKHVKTLASDMWGTPPALARATVEVCADLLGWNSDTSFCEPCAGDGVWLRIIQEKYWNILGFECDVPVDRDIYNFRDADSLTQTWSADVTIGNPPFSNWLAHVMHYRKQSRWVVQVLKQQAVLEVRKRCKFRGVNGPLRDNLRYHFPLPRINFVPLVGQKAKSSDPMAMAVFVWDREHTRRIETRYDIAARMGEIEADGQKARAV